MFSLTSLNSYLDSLEKKKHNKAEQRGITAYPKYCSPCTRTGNACASGGARKHTHKKRHICSLLIKGKEKTLSKYKVAQGHFDLPCWVLQTFKALFVQLGKCIKHRILVCVEAALKAELSQVPPHLHCWCHLLNTLVQGENQQVTFCSLPPDVQKSIYQELKATVLLKITVLLLCPCPSSPSFLRTSRIPDSHEIRGRAPWDLGAITWRTNTPAG